MSKRRARHSKLRDTGGEALGPRHAAVKLLRELLRDRKAREREGVFVAEGPHLLGAAVAHGAPIVAVYATIGVEVDAPVPVLWLAPGVADKVGDTVTSQGVFTTVRLGAAGLDALAAADLALVGAPLADPGNVGTLLRSAAAAGATVVGLGSGSVDAYNPKVVRASAGACFAIPTVTGISGTAMLNALGAAGVRRIGAVATGGVAPESLDLRAPTAIVLGHETQGLDPDLPIDERVTIPMAAGESLNVAMAGTVLLFEVARQRRGRA